MRAGETLSIAYQPTTWQPHATRRAVLFDRYLFVCRCVWCGDEAPDVARAFRCQRCERGAGAVCPRGDGTHLDSWECVQCGWRPDQTVILDMLAREAQLARVKADKAQGLAKLVGDEFVHFGHWIVLRKLDEWAEVAWRAQDASLAVGIIEALVKCCDRVGLGEDDAVLLGMAAGAGGSAPALSTGGDDREQRRREGREQPDATKAQYLEFLGKVQHALGNAHTARDAYRRAWLARVACGQRLAWWTRATRYMAADKTLADLMDSK